MHTLTLTLTLTLFLQICLRLWRQVSLRGLFSFAILLTRTTFVINYITKPELICVHYAEPVKASRELDLHPGRVRGYTVKLKMVYVLDHPVGVSNELESNLCNCSISFCFCGDDPLSNWYCHFQSFCHICHKFAKYSSLLVIPSYLSKICKIYVGLWRHILYIAAHSFTMLFLDAPDIGTSIFYGT